MCVRGTLAEANPTVLGTTDRRDSTLRMKATAKSFEHRVSFVSGVSCNYRTGKRTRQSRNISDSTCSAGRCCADAGRCFADQWNDG